MFICVHLWLNSVFLRAFSVASVTSVAKDFNWKMNSSENQKDTQKQAESRRLAWRCRRGLLELDIVLQRFVVEYYEGLSVAELSAFDTMLALPDNDFWALVSSENAQPINLETLAVINKIKTLQHLVES